MSQTKALREEYLRTQNLANMDIMSGSPATKYQREGAKNNALRKLPELQISLLNSIMKDSVTVVVTEDVPDTKNFSELASGNDNVFVVGFRTIDRLISNTLYPKDMETGYPINAELINRLNSLLAGDISYQIGAERMPIVQPSATLYGVAKTRAALEGKISNILRETYGTELNRIYTSKLINEETLKRLKSDKIISILTEVPLNLVKEVGKMTGRSVVITTTELPGAIKYDSDMTGNDIRAAIAKSVTKGTKATTQPTVRKET